jgi:hypothetical protein
LSSYAEEIGPRIARERTITGFIAVIAKASFEWPSQIHTALFSFPRRKGKQGVLPDRQNCFASLAGTLNRI